jgi:hypothetical protein
MIDSAKQRMIAETVKRRDDAVRLLKSLLDAKSVSEKNLAQSARPHQTGHRAEQHGQRDRINSATDRFVQSRPR